MSSNWRDKRDCKPKSNYWQKNSNSRGKRKHQYKLEPGVSGFICTCVGKIKEKDCVRDSYNILNEFADQLFGTEDKAEKFTEPKINEDEDVDASLEEELASLKNESKDKDFKRRFQVIDSGANGVVFIKTTVPDPVALAYQIASFIAESKVQKSKFVLRLLPVEVVCFANINDICKAAEALFDKYFAEGNKTFSIAFSHRNNDRLSRDSVIDELASLVAAKNSTNKVDLKTPQLTVLVEAIRSVCCISVVPNYFKLKKYNLLELCTTQTDEVADGVTQAEEGEPINVLTEESCDNVPDGEKLV